MGRGFTSSQSPSSFFRKRDLWVKKTPLICHESLALTTPFFEFFFRLLLDGFFGSLYNRPSERPKADSCGIEAISSPLSFHTLTDLMTAKSMPSVWSAQESNLRLPRGKTHVILLGLPSPPKRLAHRFPDRPSLPPSVPSRRQPRYQSP